jgi:salicylate hydroxylase
VLADCLAQQPDDPIRALDAYRRAREPRVDRIVAASQTNGRIYHMSGPLALARDTAMRLMGGARLLERYDWLYGWRAE